MAFKELIGLSNRLLTNVQGLAAIAARLRLDQLVVEGDPAVRVQLDRALDALGAREHVQELDEGERSMLLAFARSYLEYSSPQHRRGPLAAVTWLVLRRG